MKGRRFWGVTEGKCGFLRVSGMSRGHTRPRTDGKPRVEEGMTERTTRLKFQR